eukprot:CAMPEP_0185697196 /NCGR_PEP_ID=MMETSP1164-20130828/5598_1 /TAXON_ID=1104430 /ORGANISM="Chrysoreinhardia sp, Strain CCMP2950" /LENGTH=133 /DNA_ID=CAMNT_0028364091 /DNA_START=179 /DNA_END=579 /DNA_ORIENTATION=-
MTTPEDAHEDGHCAQRGAVLARPQARRLSVLVAAEDQRDLIEWLKTTKFDGNIGHLDPNRKWSTGKLKKQKPLTETDEAGATIIVVFKFYYKLPYVEANWYRLRRSEHGQTWAALKKQGAADPGPLGDEPRKT